MNFVTDQARLWSLPDLAIAASRFMQKILTPILGGRAARPYRYMIGTTDFNSDLFLAEHLMIEDEAAATDISSRKHFWPRNSSNS